jgi:hypothetical protein
VCFFSFQLTGVGVCALCPLSICLTLQMTALRLSFTPASLAADEGNMKLLGTLLEKKASEKLNYNDGVLIDAQCSS